MTRFETDSLTDNWTGGWRYFIEITAYRISTATEVTLRYASIDWSTPDGSISFKRRLIGRPTLRRTVFGGGFELGGSSFAAPGKVKLSNKDHHFDQYYSDYTFDGREIKVYIGLDHYTLAEIHETVLIEGLIDRPIFEYDALEFEIFDKQSELKRRLSGNTVYSGGNDDETDKLGDVRVEGKIKPAVYGQVFNIKPTLINEAGWIYQCHGYGPIQGITEVRDNGVPLTLNTDYTVNLTDGTFTLVGEKDGEITADVQGSDTGAVYVTKIGDIAQRFITDHTNLVVGDLDSASVTAVNTAEPSTLGLATDPGNKESFSGDERYSYVSQALDFLFRGIGGWYGVNRANKVEMGIVSPPSGSPVITIREDIKTQVLETRHIHPVSWRTTLNYEKNHYPQQESSIAGSVNTTDRHRFAQSWLSVPFSDSSILTRHKFAVDRPRIDSPYQERADALARATALQGIHGTRRTYLKIRITHPGWRVDLMDVVMMKSDRYDWDDKLFRVVGYETNFDTFDLELWG